MTREEQQKLLATVAELGDEWKAIAERMGLKSKREAILEFLKVTISDTDRLHH